ncbi:MAG: hypothetical protein FWH18_03950 [Marinilabiliaceae bacterium]|nr:hypothetical protein [Marinilabiliaceae bacterium]
MVKNTLHVTKRYFNKFNISFSASGGVAPHKVLFNFRTPDLAPNRLSRIHALSLFALKQNKPHYIHSSHAAALGTGAM